MHRLEPRTFEDEEARCYVHRRPPDKYTAEEVEETFGGAATFADLSAEQAEIHKHIVKWFSEAEHGMAYPGQVLTVGGLAGTGKTTLLSVLANTLSYTEVAYCALTGRAASILRKKLRAAGASPAYIGTIHSLFYKAVADKESGTIQSFKRVDPEEIRKMYKLIVVDEASMIDEELAADLCAPGLPVLAVGDHGQLPPINGPSFWMADPHLRLKHIHRQVVGSPIISLAMHVRQQQSLDGYRCDGRAVDVIKPAQFNDALAAAYKTHTPREVSVLVFSNKLRVTLNQNAHYIWTGQTPDQLPCKTSWLICLRNRRRDGLCNGMRAELIQKAAEYKKHWLSAAMYYPDEQLEAHCDIFRYQLHRPSTFSDLRDVQLACETSDMPKWKQVGMLLDYGYAMTVHKAQGSQFKHVFLVYERPMFAEKEDFARWLYTGITRSSQRLTLVLNE